MAGLLSAGTGRLLGALATLVVVIGVGGSVVSLVTSLGSEETLVLLFGAGVLWLNVLTGIRGVPSTDTAYW